VATARSLWTDPRITDRFLVLDERLGEVKDTVDALSGMPVEVRDLLLEHERRMSDLLLKHRGEIRQEIREVPRPLTFWRMAGAIAVGFTPLYAILAAALLS
jgi:hypothetical protein